MLASFSNVPTKLRFTKYRKRTTIPGRFELTHTSPNKPGTAVLKAVTDGRLSPAQLEAARKVLRRKLKKVGTIKAYTFPSVAITKKSVGVRMGKGRSAVADWVFPVRRGKLIFEVSSPSVGLSAEALLLAGKKLPVLSKVVVLERFL